MIILDALLCVLALVFFTIILPCIGLVKLFRWISTWRARRDVASVVSNEPLTEEQMKKDIPFVFVCAWCEAGKSEANFKNPHFTHGICPGCKKKMEVGWDLAKEEEKL